MLATLPLVPKIQENQREMGWRCGRGKQQSGWQSQVQHSTN